MSPRRGQGRDGFPAAQRQVLLIRRNALPIIKALV